MNKKSTSFHVSGMHCASCAANIQRKLSKTDGVIEASVNYANEQASVTFGEEKINTKTIEKIVKKLGYKAYIDVDENQDIAKIERENELKDLKTKLLISSILAIILMSSMIPGAPKILHNKLVMWILATPIQFWAGSRFYKGAWSSLKNKTTNMDTLVVLGTSVAYFYSVFVTTFGNILSSYNIPLHVYFEASASIITLVLLGKYLEIKSKGQASEAIKKLLSLQAKTANKVIGNKIISTPIEEITKGDILLVKPGEKVPLDGKIVEGESSIDESMVTGESLPVNRVKNDVVVGSTINLSSALKIKVEKVGSETMLSQIIEMVKKAQGSKPPIQKLVDTISSYFVPIVILLSTITFAIWFLFGPDPKILNALVSSITVLIIACPCALGLATPTSLMVGVGRGANKGILIKNAQALEIANKINVMIFDKTGTLTKGNPSVQNISFAKTASKSEEKNISSIISSIENLSHHPIAQAIVNHFNNKNISPSKKITNFKDVSGKGVEGSSGKDKIIIGTQNFIEEQGIIIDKPTLEMANKWKRLAQSVSFVGINKKIITIIGVADEIKSESKKVIESLKNMKIKTVMLTGDNKQTAAVVSRKLEIDEVQAEVLPKDKEKIVRKYTKKGKIVAMLGDGINDAPALAAADIGIAMGSGTDIAMESAGITLLHGNISLATSAIKLSKATMNNITQNLFWAFGYNIVLIPVAMGVLYPFFGIQINPIMAGAAMAFSSVSVVTNALRLRKISI
ncbi:heavy metal translocating P-type ATPase [Patescibacteria group bacterium]